MSLSLFKNKIFVVDDSLENLLLIEAMLQGQGYEIILIQDSLSALQQIQRSPPHLILLDVMMPQMDGYEVTKQIKQDPNLPFIPILLITADDRASVAQGLDLGADEFIRKPVDVDELSARVRSLLRLKHSVDEAEQMNSMREDFVSRLTHDLRTPLIASDRMLDLLLKGTLGELSNPIVEALTTMARSNHNLLQMVNKLLEVYRYEAAQKILNFSTIDLQKLIQEVIKELMPLLQEKRLIIKFVTHSEGSENYQVKGDHLELYRLWVNLLGNAVKFTERGDILITLKKVEISAKSWIVISIQDTGIGISQEEQQGLFNRFRSGNNRYAGSGLGLHLSRQIVETHRGTIEVDSELNQGSVFTVRLPAYLSY